MVSSAHRKYRFTWRKGNRFEVLVDGGAFFPQMLHAIGGARRHVLLEMYLFASGAVANRFIGALVAAAARGVAVRVLLDDFGARALNRSDRERLRRGGVETVLYNPFRLRKLSDNFARDHRKLLIVDGDIAFVGGAGITDDFDPPGDAEHRWRETMVRIEGPVVTDWQALFAGVWQRVTGARPMLAAPPEAVRSEDMLGRVAVIRSPVSQEIKRSLLKRIRAAERRVWIATAYFIPTWRIRRALRQAAHHGVDVRLLLPGPYTDHPAVRHAGRRFYGRLLAGGVRIFEYQPRVLHAKAALCDHWASIGSSNLDRWNLRWNLEANQEVDDQRFAGQVEKMFEYDFADSIEWRHQEWQRRPRYARLAERWWGRVDLWLDRLGRGRRGED